MLLSMQNTQNRVPTNNQTFTYPIVIGKYNITLDDKTISYTLKCSSRAKLLWLDIKRQTGLTVTIPKGYNMRNLTKYLESNSTWILRNISKYCSETPAAIINNVKPKNTVSYLGKCLKVMQRRNGCGTNEVKMKQNKLIVSLYSSGANLSSHELEDWLRSQAKIVIKDKVSKFSKQMGLVYNHVAIRDQKSRWGSCSCLKNLNFNWRLIMAPEPVLDYVIIHELCHLREMSHSKTFWELVALYCPKWHEYRDWLDNHYFELNAQIP
jgi:predicted metal-dependent hydrolase